MQVPFWLLRVFTDISCPRGGSYPYVPVSRRAPCSSQLGVHSMLHRECKGERFLCSGQLKMIRKYRKRTQQLWSIIFLSLISMCLQFVKSKPHYSPRRSACLFLFEHTGNGDLYKLERWSSMIKVLPNARKWQDWVWNPVPSDFEDRRSLSVDLGSQLSPNVLKRW